ncbi:Na+/H+ antiporter NhaC family protein [Pseudoneobacillus sp. C159]
MAVSLHKPLVVGFLPGFLLLVGLAKRKGMTFQQIYTICQQGVTRTSGVIWILFLVGFLLPSWYYAGTIEQMVAISLHFIRAEHFLVLSFIISIVFSMILGTSVGTLSSIGIPIIGSAITLQIPVEMVAGAVISGAFVGDRTSPFSSAHQLLAQTLEIQVKHQFRAMLKTTILAIIFGILFFSYLDNHLQVNGNLKPILLEALSISKFIPPAILVLVVMLRIKVLYAFIFSISSACVIALSNGVSFSMLIFSLWTGVSGLGGGLSNMYLLLLFLALAGAYNGLLEELKVISILLNKWVQSSHSLLADTVKTMLVTLGVTLIAANQTLPIILTGRTFLEHWRKRYRNGELSRVMADSTMLFPGIVPWSVLTIMCSTITGVSIFSYFQYAIFLWLLPVLTILVSLTNNGKAIQKLWNV